MLKTSQDCEIAADAENNFSPCYSIILQRIRKLLQTILVASVINPRAHKHINNKNAIICERTNQLRRNVLIIHPFSTFRYWWDFLMALNLVGSFLFIPHRIAFDMSRTKIPSWTIIKNFFLTIDCLDILMSFSTGYFAKTPMTVEMDMQKLTKRYIIRGTFIADLFGSIPTDLFFIPFWNDLIVARELSSMIHIFRIASIYTYITIVGETYNVPNRLFGIFTFIPLFVICLHWLACIMWITPIANISLISIDASEYSSSFPSWINLEKLWSAENQQKYWSSVMRSIAILTRSGYLMKEPHAGEDQYIATLVLILGTLVICYIVSQIVQMFKGGNSSKMRYQVTVTELKQYMRYKQLEKIMQKRFLTYYEFRYQEHFFRESEILNTLSSQMKLAIGMQSCRKLVENVTFFNNLPVSLLTRIVAQLKSEIFLKNDIIIRAGQIGGCMYFIATGTIAIYTDSGKEICHLEDGAHFGEIALIMPDEKRVANVIVVETCELYRLERSDFIRTIHPYPMLWDKIKQIAMERHENTMILGAH